MNKLVSLISSISLASILSSCVIYETEYRAVVESKGIVLYKDKLRIAPWPSDKEYTVFIKSELEGIITHNTRELYHNVQPGDSVIIYTINKDLIGKSFGKENYNKTIEIQRSIKKIIPQNK